MSSENPTKIKCLIIEDGYDLIAVPITERISVIIPELLLEIRKVDKLSEGGLTFASRGRIKFYITDVSEVESGNN
jgi:hypothetical protein